MKLLVRYIFLSVVFNACFCHALMLTGKPVVFEQIRKFSVRGARTIRPLAKNPNFCAVLDKKGRIEIWDWEKQEKVKTLIVPNCIHIDGDCIGQLDELEDGRLVSLSGTASNSFVARIWQVENGSCVECPTVSFWPKPSLAILKDSDGKDCIVVRTDCRSLMIWSLDNNVTFLKTHTCNNLEKISPPGYIVTQCSNDLICLHCFNDACFKGSIDPSSCFIKHTIDSNVSLNYSSIIKMSNRIACISSLCDVTIFDVEKYAKFTFNTHDTIIEGICTFFIKEYGELLISWDQNTIKTWDIKDSKNIELLGLKNISEGIQGFFVSGPFLFVLTKNAKIEVYIASIKNNKNTILRKDITTNIFKKI